MTSVQITPCAASDRRPIGCGGTARAKQARSGATSSPPRIRTGSRRSTALPGRLASSGYTARRRHRMAGAPVRRGRRQPSIGGTGDRRRSTAAGRATRTTPICSGDCAAAAATSASSLIRIRAVSGERDLRRIRRLSAGARQAGVERLRAMDEDRARHADVRRASRALSAGAGHPGTAARRVRDRHHGLLHRERDGRRGVGEAAAVARHAAARYVPADAIRGGRDHRQRSARGASALYFLEWRRAARHVVRRHRCAAAHRRRSRRRHLPGRSASCRRRARTSARRRDAVRVPIAVVHFRAGRGAHAAGAGRRQAIGRRAARGRCSPH